MRREDARYRFFARQLQAFTAVYTQTTRHWLTTFMRDPANVTQNEYGYRTSFPSQVLERIVGFDKVKRLFRAGPWLEPRHLALPYYDQVITPFNHQVMEELALWWKREWRRQHLNFAHIPPAPPFEEQALQRVSQRHWTYSNQFQVLFRGDKWARTCQISTLSDLEIWSFDVPSMPLTALPVLVQPRLRRLAALTDWHQAETLPPPVHRALARRVEQFKTFYRGRAFSVQPLPLPQRLVTPHTVDRFHQERE